MNAKENNFNDVNDGNTPHLPLPKLHNTTPTSILATTIPDSWFQLISRVLDIGNKTIVQYGSFVGETRLEFYHATIHITHPYAEPWNTMLPEIPAHMGIPNPVSDEYIEQYLPYLMTTEKQEGESYTYGSRIWPQVPAMIQLLYSTPNTNQAVLQVARPGDMNLDDPPCLRHIDMRVLDGVLHFYPYFRSWDLYSGYPANLAAIAILQKYIADEIGVECGGITASSKGLHIYGYVEEMAKIRAGKSGGGIV
jgi:thymidylate synthase